MNTQTPRLVHTTLATPLGEMLLACDETGLVGCWFVGQKHMPDTRTWAADTRVKQNQLLHEAQDQLKRYFKGELQAFDVVLSQRVGTPFQREVWQALAHIPFGQTTSYGHLAQQLGRPKASRAVGATVGRNPWSVVVPCHRVMGSQGTLTGYAGGLACKAALLQLEGVRLKTAL